MKIRIFILMSLLLTQCNSNDYGQNDNNTSVSKTSDNGTKVSTIQNSVVKKIQNYYINGEGDELKLETNKSDSLIELIFKNNNAITMMRIEIPKVLHSDSTGPILLQDFNSDGLKDVVVSVYREGGWGGGNVFDTEIFVFKNEKNDYILKSVNYSKNLTNCNSGQFSLEGLKNGKLAGTSFCYSPDDAHCCPSLEYRTILSEENWKLKHFRSTMISKNASSKN